MSKPKPCSAPGCQRMSRNHGLCDAHWQRLKSGKGLRPEIPIKHVKTKYRFNLYE
jgi:hypothetical protein